MKRPPTYESGDWSPHSTIQAGDEYDRFVRAHENMCRAASGEALPTRREIWVDRMLWASLGFLFASAVAFAWTCV